MDGECNGRKDGRWFDGWVGGQMVDLIAGYMSGWMLMDGWNG